MAVYGCFCVVQYIVNFLTYVYGIPGRLKSQMLSRVFDDKFSRFGILTDTNNVITLFDYENVSFWYLVWIWIQFEIGWFSPEEVGFAESDIIKYYFWTSHKNGQVYRRIAKSPSTRMEPETKGNNVIYAILNNTDITCMFKSYWSSIRTLPDMTAHLFTKIAFGSAQPGRLQIMDEATMEEKIFENDDVIVMEETT